MNEIMYKWIVYITINKLNGKFFIGCHKVVDPKIWDYNIGLGVYSDSGAKRLQKLNPKYPFINAVVKYGYNSFKRTIIRIFDDEQEAMKFKCCLVSLNVIKSTNCYNSKVGGESVFEYADKRIYQYRLNGEFCRAYKSIKLAIETNNLDRQELLDCLNRKVKSCGGFYWNWEKSFDYNKKDIKICQYDLNGNFVNVWCSIKQAEEAWNTSAIERAIKNHTIAAKFQWRYYEGNFNNIEPYKDSDIV